MKVVVKTEIGEKIKEMRSKKNINQTQLASMAKISRSFMCDIEVGRALPSLKTLEKIAQALEVDIKDFL